MPTKVSDKQRVEELLTGEACSVSSAPAAGRPTANPSRLKVMNWMLLLAVNVSVLLKGACTFNTVSPAPSWPLPLTSENTIQPFCQAELARQVVLFEDTQTETLSPSLMASRRAYCRSPSRPLTSALMRLRLVTYRYDGTPIAI